MANVSRAASAAAGNYLKLRKEVPDRSMTKACHVSTSCRGLNLQQAAGNIIYGISGTDKEGVNLGRKTGKSATVDQVATAQ